ncbi:V-type ATP synthase subunit E [Pseudoramibacter alactolyticus]|jgi:V/A-type H+-transporting ATPase subunit E|uniref:V-type ATP synthase subunit E n=1 Tax=Pseudoramibacter alactolyticus TaxID=113287 RepID=UPI002357429C|nr:V-type ATP synthase subunit E [Pseudoramibacter alactolyticus]MBM6968278.1 V-type ATP synthase subunit E [Pseudoramibacter alactolyticus]
MAENIIIEKILKGAEAEAESIMAEGDRRVQAIKEEMARQIEKDRETLLEKNKAAIAEIHDRGELMSHLETRKNTLAAKRKVIDEAFDGAREQLRHLDDEKWSVLIASMVAESVVTGDGKLRVPARDREKYENGFLDSLNRGLQANGLSGQLTLDDQPADFEAGVMLVGEDSDINGDFDVLLDAVREKYERQVAAILFDDQHEA